MTSYLILSLLYLVVIVLAFALGAVLAVLYIFRDQKRHPMKRLDAMLDCCIEVADGVLYRAADLLMGTHRVISKRTARAIIKRSQVG